MNNNKGIYKLIKLLFLGACTGLLISAIFLLPWFYNYSKKIKIESYQQSNLVNASGLAIDSFQTFPIEITALNDGVPIGACLCYEASVEGVDSRNVLLKAGDTIQLFAAERGKYDSKIISYKASGK